MSKDMLSAKYDIVFKKMFSDVNNEDLLRHFLSNLLSMPLDSIKEVTVNNPEIIPESLNEKFGQMDIRLKLNDSIVNVEMQISNEPDFKDRVLYYWSKLYSGDLKEGESYSNLRKSISISIVNFNLFDCPEFHSLFKLKEDTRGELLSDKCEIHFFELKKTASNLNCSNLTELWLQLIKADTEEEFNMLSNTQVPEIKKAVNVIREMSDDERIKEMVRFREKRHEEATRLEEAQQRGIEEGLAKGMAKGMKDGLAKGMKDGLAKGMKDGLAKGKEEERANIIKLLREAGTDEEYIKMIENMNK